MRLFSDRASATTISRDPRGGRGVALLVVLTSVAVLTAVAVDFSYNTRVDSTLAVHARDSLRAEYMAKSALNFGRLVLHFQSQIDGQAGQIQNALGSLTGALAGSVDPLAAAGAAAALGGAGGGGLGGIGSLRLWELLPVDSGAIAMFVGAAAAAPSLDAPLPGVGADAEPGKAVPAAGLLSFGTFDGGFHAEIVDEESKLNLNKLNNPGTRGRIAAEQIYALWIDPRWDFLFERDNSRGERYNRLDLLTLLRDYIDEDEVESSIDQTAFAAAGGDVFVAGFGDEEGPYTRYEPRYKPKNALFDSLPEVYLVPGITDRFMAAFGDRLTVYPDINSRLNVNTSDPLQQLANIQAAARDPSQPALQDPRIIQTIFEQLAVLRAIPGVGITVQSFASIVEAAGIPVKPEIKNNAQNDFFSDKSQTFTIRATGRAGDVERTLTAVIRYDQALGKLLYYREE